jgi:hypothetical protein
VGRARDPRDRARGRGGRRHRGPGHVDGWTSNAARLVVLP